MLLALNIICIPNQGGIVVSTHTIELTQENLIGSFTNEVTPILSVKSGDSIRFQRWMRAGEQG